eukprot:Skav218653  [mRNA]  locus=scaffold365:755551:756039:- [translate_table: standard]
MQGTQALLDPVMSKKSEPLPIWAESWALESLLQKCFPVIPAFPRLYNPRTHVESLLVSPISKASAMQRVGRPSLGLSARSFGDLQLRHVSTKELCLPSSQTLTLDHGGNVLQQLGFQLGFHVSLDASLHHDLPDPAYHLLQNGYIIIALTNIKHGWHPVTVE